MSMIITINSSAKLNRILEHHRDKIDLVRQNEETRINTKMSNDLLDGFKQKIEQCIRILGTTDQTMGIDTDEVPFFQSTICMSLDQYIKDLEKDLTILENELSIVIDDDESQKNEIKIINSIKRDCGCKE